MSNQLKPFFTYFGGKWRSAPKYPAVKHGSIIEPFAGSAGYSVRNPENEVVLVEKDPVISETWRYLLGSHASDIRNLPAQIEDGQNVRELDIPRGAQYLIGWWLNKGASRPCLTPSAWMRSGIRPNSYWGEAIRERIASQVSRISHWQLIEGSYELAPDREATWFIDPPYQLAGRDYKFGPDQIDFTQLAKWCQSRQGLVVACENVGASWLPFVPFETAKATPGKGRVGVSKEAIWIQQNPQDHEGCAT